MTEFFAANDSLRDPWLLTFFTYTPLWIRLVVTFAFGVVVGRGVVFWLLRMRLPEGIWTSAGLSEPLNGVRARATLAVELAMGALFAGLVYFVIILHCQETPEEGSAFYIHWRLLFQFALITFLMAATVVDLEQYLIPDAITATGAIVGIGMATAVGNVQLIPLWVDWNLAVPGLAGPYIPVWIQTYSHLHGLAWSLTGLVAGAGITWIVRAVASWLLGQEALGFGDVTLMGMIGSFMGWQAIVFVFALGPLCGLVVGLTVRILTGRTYVPYGPYLSISAVIVLYSWKWLWTPSRYIFGDAITLGILAATALVAMIVLLGLSRLYRLIPVERTHGEPPQESESQLDQEPLDNEESLDAAEPLVDEEPRGDEDAQEDEEPLLDDLQ
ncbi:prepilin peptidase [Symmachiella dynata]|nr:A24 family peptidase [Symmachiella dynata]